MPSERHKLPDELRRAALEADLHATSNQLTTLIASLRVGVLAEDNSDRIVMANPALCRALGCEQDPAALVGRVASEVIEELGVRLDARINLLHERAEIMAAGEPLAGQTLATADGRVLELSYEPVLDGGRQVGHLWQFDDVTERHRQAEAIVLSEEKYSKLFYSSSDAIILYDLDGFIQDINPMAERLVGYRRDELLTMSLRELYPDEVAEAAGEAVVHIAREGQATYEIPFLRKDGSTFEGEVSASCYEYRGEFIVLSLIRDASLRKQTEARLRMLSLVASKSGSSVIIMDAGGRVEWVNEAFTTLTGYRLEQVRGRDPMAVLAGRDTDSEVLASVRRRMADRQDLTEELLYYKRSGERYWVSTTITPVFDERGAVEKFIAVETDVTGARQIQAELIRARDAAEEASRAKGEFLAVMSHEIRTPLNAILGMTDLVLHESLSPAQRSMLRTIQSNSEALLAIINDVLDLSRVESAEFCLESVSFAPGEVAEAVTDALGVHADGKGIELTCLVDAGVPELVVGDPQRLRQVLTNLVGNAVKFTESGHVALSLRAVATDGSHARLGFRVEDTGVGIPEDKREAIFGRFVQADSSTQRRFGGTGLGLSISRALVEQMGGQVSCTSEVGVGSEFLVELELPVARWRAAEPSVAGDLRGLTALVVDGQPRSRSVVAELLAGWGVEVREAGTTAALAEELARPRCELLLVDREIASPLRAALSRDGRRPVLLTRLRDFEAELARELRASLVTKPVRRKTLLAAVAAARGIAVDLDRAQTAAPARAVALEAGLRALVVDDSSDSRAVLVRFVERMGLEVVAVESGAEALRCLADSRFDLLLTDLEMPGMDGLELARRVRREPTMHSLPIVAVTAHAVEGYEARCREAGMNAYLTKPVRREKLERTLAELVTPARAVLVVDDSPDMRTLVERFLQAEGGFEVHCADGGEAALAVASSRDFDVVLLDMLMPGMSGLEVAERLRAEHPKLPVVAMSGLDGEADRSRSRAAGCVAHLAKPVRRAALVSCLREVLAAHCAPGCKPVAPIVAPAPTLEPLEPRSGVDAQLAELVPGFLAKRRREQVQLRAAAEAGDWAQLAKAGHRLAGVGGSYGFARISELGAELESGAAARDVSTCVELLDQLGAYLDGLGPSVAAEG